MIKDVIARRDEVEARVTPLGRLVSTSDWMQSSLVRVLKQVMLYVSACVTGLAAFWLLFCVFGMWFIGPPPDPSLSERHNFLLRAGMSLAFAGAACLLAFLSRLAMNRARCHRPEGA